MSNFDLDNNDAVRENFPRELSGLEKELLYSVLPKYKQGYKEYRNKIGNLYVTGAGRFGGGNLMLGEKNTIPDITSPSASVLAIGTVVYEECTADISIHEEIDNEIEIDITFSQDVDRNNLHEVKRWSYSEWNPGDKAPNDKSEVREIIIDKNKYVLAIAQDHKKIWLHSFVSGINHLIPVSNLYNYIMLIKNVRDGATVSKPSLFFSNHKSYNDAEIVSAFLIYNKYFKKFKIDDSVFEPEIDTPKPKGIFKFLKRG